MSIVDVGNEGHLLAQIDALEAEVERLHKHGSDLNSELLDVRIKHVGEKDELQRKIAQLQCAVRELFRLEAITETEDPGVGIDRYYARQALIVLVEEGDAS